MLRGCLYGLCKLALGLVLFVSGLLSLLIIGFGFTLPKSMTSLQRSDDAFITVFGSQIRYRTADHPGPTVIFLHGFGGSLDAWDPLFQHMRCGKMISMDMIGFGLSERPDIRYTLETQHRYLLSFMDTMNIDKAVLVGHSMGASLALWTAALSKGRIEALVLLAPSGYAGSLRHQWPASLLYKPGYLNDLGKMLVRTHYFGAVFKRNLGRQALDVTGSYDASFTAALSQISQPTLIMWSRNDQRVPFLYMSEYLARIPQAQVFERPEQVKHSAPKSDAPEVAEAICAFLNRAGLQQVEAN